MPVRPSPASKPIARFGRLGRWFSLGRALAAPRAGFTLLEMTLALAMIGLITALALPRIMTNAGPTALRMKAFEIAALLRTDRNAALRSGRVIVTAVDAGARRVRSGASGATIAVPPAFAMQLASGTASGFRFFPDGTSSGGELILARPDAGLSVRVNDLTAAVSIRRQETGRGG